MKRIGVVSIFDLYNYGNRLQSYATIEFLKKFGFKTRNIIRIKLYRTRRVIRDLLDLFFAKDKEAVSRKKLFMRFSTKNISKDLYYKAKALKNYAYIICGSDQIWNYEFAGHEYFFGTIAPPEKRIAFSASFGVSEIPESKKEFYKKHLNEMKAISVREQAGVEIVKELTGRDATLLVDPTMMLSKEDWQKVSKKPRFSVPEKYIFTYFLGNVTDEMREFIDKVAKENDMQIINLEAKEPNNYWYSSGPSEFVWLIEHASIVLTDSFHGSVFSIINEAPFVVFDRVENIECMNSRIDTLLSTLKLEDRRFDKIDMNKLFEKEYSHVPEILEREKKKAIEFLKNAMEI